MQEQFDEIYRLFSKLILGDLVREGTSTSIKHSLVNIYTMDDNSEALRYSRLSGILSLDIDRKLKSTFFRMYSLDSFQLLFQCELYYGFENYRQITETLWAFDFLDGIIALEFPTTLDGNQMANTVKQHSHKKTQYFHILQSRRKDQQEKKKEGTFFGKIKNIFAKQNNIKKQNTKIISVVKQNSVTFDPYTGKFDYIPPQLQLTFTQMGFTKKQLQNKEIAQLLMQEILVFQTLKEAADDPSAIDLRKTIKKYNLQVNDVIQEQQSQLSIPELPQGVLPPPPPLPKIHLPPNPIVSKIGGNSCSNSRSDLLNQIRAGGVKLKPVSNQGNKLKVDMSNMDKDERQDLSSFLRAQLSKRRGALLREQQRNSLYEQN